MTESTQVSPEMTRAVQNVQTEVHEALERSQDFDNWLPPVGTYEVTPVSFQEGTKQPDEGGPEDEYPWYRIDVSLLDGEYEGETFGVLFTFRPGKSRGPNTDNMRKAAIAVTIAMEQEVPQAWTLLTMRQALLDAVDKGDVTVIAKIGIRKHKGNEYPTVKLQAAQ